MMKNWLRALIGLSMFALLGRLLGFVREMLIASSFGANDITDSYLTALILFDIAMAANASFLQGTFAYSAEMKSKEGFEKQLYKIGFKIFFIIFITALVFYPAANYIIPLFYSHSPQANETIIKSSQLFFILSSFLAASGVFAALLQMRGNITNPGRLIIFLNIASISFLLLFRNSFGIISMPLGFLCGGILFFIYQIFLIKKEHPVQTEETGKNGFVFTGWLLVSFLIYANALFPSILGLMERYFAYAFTGGSFSHYQYSQKILQLPLTILSFAISTSLLPFQIKSVNDGNENDFLTATRRGVIISVITSAFFVILFYSLAEPIIQIIFERGKFTHPDTLETAASLRTLSLGMVPFLLNPIIANIFFSKKSTRKLIFINLIFILIQAASLVACTNLFPGIKALTINWIVVVWLNSIVLVIYVIRKKYYTDDRITAVKILFVLIFTALIVITARMFLPAIENPFISLAVSGAILLSVYLLFILLVFASEIRAMLHK